MKDEIIESLQEIESRGTEMARLEQDSKQYVNNPSPVGILDELFRQTLHEIWKQG